MPEQPRYTCPVCGNIAIDQLRPVKRFAAEWKYMIVCQSVAEVCGLGPVNQPVYNLLWQWAKLAAAVQTIDAEEDYMRALRSGNAWLMPGGFEGGPTLHDTIVQYANSPARKALAQARKEAASRLPPGSSTQGDPT